MPSSLHPASKCLLANEVHVASEDRARLGRRNVLRMYYMHTAGVPHTMGPTT